MHLLERMWGIPTKMEVPEEDFNSYATHRGDSLNRTTSNLRQPFEILLFNEMVKGRRSRKVH